MNDLIRFVQKLDYIRLCVGICILVDGYPLIFFFRDALRLAPGSSAFTAAAFAGGLVLMVPFTVLRRLYRPNITMFWLGIGFLLLSIIYMYVYASPGVQDKGREMIYFAFIFIFLFLLINIPNDIITVIIPVIVFFTLVSNLGLVYSLITDPSWAIGQRATIVLNNSEDGSGNPHVFARNAFMGVVACAIWLMRPDTSFFFRLLSLFSGVLSIAVLVLTQTRSAIVALIIAVFFFIVFNVRSTQIRMAVRGIFKPGPIIVMCIGVVGIILFFRRYDDIYSVLSSYVIGFIDRNLENVYALLGMQAQGVAYKAVLDDSAANRSTSFGFLTNILIGHMNMLVFGYGYKYQYLDIPIIEALTNLGVLGFILFGGINGMVLYYSIRNMRIHPNQLSVFLAYFYMLILVQLFTNGRPYEMFFWIPLAMMIRFIGVEHLFPIYLSDHPAEVKGEQYVVVSNPT
ncbi:O-antigen ligase family protein [Spirosoma sp.]|uniref:O-antigen ligase family protein n=1 Tax=Spirosoma sp. TaxID=1899569 RepID=UPI003B3BCD8E